MRILVGLSLAIVLLGVSAPGSPPVKCISLCAFQRNPQRFLGKVVKLDDVTIIGTSLQQGKCFTYNFDFGDDYQNLGDRFPAKQDAQWHLMRKILLSPGPCFGGSGRAVRATVIGTVARTPPSGTFRKDQMPPEIVIQSVSRVSRVHVNCKPHDWKGPWPPAGGWRRH